MFSLIYKHAPITCIYNVPVGWTTTGAGPGGPPAISDLG